MYLLTQNSGATVMCFAGTAGLGPAATISKNGGSFGSSTNSPVDVGNGWYSLLLDTSETDTVGALAVHFGAGSPADFLFQVGAPVLADCVRQAGQTLPVLVNNLPPIHVSELADGSIAAAKIANDVIAKLFSTVALTESYAADGATATPAQLLYMLWSALSDFAISGVTMTCKKIDGSTQSMTFTLSPSGNPTSRTRSA